MALETPVPFPVLSSVEASFPKKREKLKEMKYGGQEAPFNYFRAGRLDNSLSFRFFLKEELVPRPRLLPTLV